MAQPTREEGGEVQDRMPAWRAPMDPDGMPVPGILQGAVTNGPFGSVMFRSHSIRPCSSIPYRLTRTISLISQSLLQSLILRRRGRQYVPLGSPITIVGLDDKYVLARITGIRPLPHPRADAAWDLDDGERTRPVLSKEPPLQSVRPELRAFAERQRSCAV
jgi:hypothetical protein